MVCAQFALTDPLIHSSSTYLYNMHPLPKRYRFVYSISINLEPGWESEGDTRSNSARTWSLAATPPFSLTKVCENRLRAGTHGWVWVLWRSSSMINSTRTHTDIIQRIPTPRTTMTSWTGATRSSESLTPHHSTATLTDIAYSRRPARAASVLTETHHSNPCFWVPDFPHLLMSFCEHHFPVREINVTARADSQNIFLSAAPLPVNADDPPWLVFVCCHLWQCRSSVWTGTAYTWPFHPFLTTSAVFSSLKEGFF